MAYGSFNRINLQLCLLLLSAASYAQNEEQSAVVRFAIQTGLSQQYPEQKGLVLTYNIPRHIFASAGLDVSATEYLSKRLPLTVARGDADLSVASKYSLIKYGEQLITSQLPTALLTFTIYYHNQNAWDPVWPPDEVFKSKIGKSKISSVYLRDSFGLNISQAATVDSIVKMVNRKRIDYWIEYASAEGLVAPGLLQRNHQDFNYKTIFSVPTYVYFRNTTRGRDLKKIFDSGLLKMLRDKQFVRIYFQHHIRARVDTTILTVAYIRENYPELNIPAQEAYFVPSQP